MRPGLNSGVYVITNSRNGKVYVGSSACMTRRKQDHWRRLRRGTHSSPHLQRAWNVYGEGAFAFTVLLSVEGKEELLRREQEVMDAARSYESKFGYNVAKSTTSPGLGRVISEVTRSRMSAAQKGHAVTESTRARIGAAGKGRTASEEAKRKMRARKHSPEARAKMSASQKGRKHSPETLAKIRDANKGVIFSEAHRARLSASKSGKPWSLSRRAAHEGRAATCSTQAPRPATEVRHV